ERMRESLINSARDVRLAIERKHLCVRAAKAAERDYQAAEAEFLAELRFEDEYVRAKTVAEREVVRDAALAKARREGDLASAWAAMLAAQAESDDAQMAYSQCEAEFRAAKAAAEITTGM